VIILKKLFINRKGRIILSDVKDPHIETVGSIVNTCYALISAGTEISIIKSSKFQSQSPIKKFIKSKDFRRKAFSIFKKTSIKKFFKMFKEYSGKKIDKNFTSPSINLTPIGYSCSGIIEETNVKGYSVNDRVACGGSNHAEKVYSPKNLSIKIPDNISLKEAAFATIGAIALNAIYRAKIKPGETVCIIGTGLIGLITIQLAKISGGIVFALDLINARLNLAKELGADFVFNPQNFNFIDEINKQTEGRGLDIVIICAASKSPKPLEDAIELVRDKGRIVLLGAIPINIPREKLYYKEADLLISRSYGAGRYDPYYEYEGFDYPEKYVPYTERRNMELFLNLISEKKVDVKSLITDIYPVDQANQAYNKLISDPLNTIAVLLDFTEKALKQENISKKAKSEPIKEELIIGLIGCGAFAQTMHLPHILSSNNYKIKAICTNHAKTAEFCKENYHPDYVTTDYKKLLKDTEINTLFIYTRHDTHKRFTIEALKANKNVFTEKPMGITFEECKEVYNAVINSKKNYIIGFNRRYSPFIKLAKDLLKNRNNPIIINYRIASKYISGNSWVYDPKIGGGPLIGELCHFTDLVLFLINSRPFELYATGGNLSHKNINTYDSCNLILKFENGSIANITYTDLNGPEMPKERIEIFSGDSAIFIDDFEKMITDGFDVGNLELPKQDKGHKEEIVHILNVNLGLEKPLITVKEAINAMNICFKTIESIRTNKPIKINGDYYD